MSSDGLVARPTYTLAGSANYHHWAQGLSGPRYVTASNIRFSVLLYSVFYALSFRCSGSPTAQVSPHKSASVEGVGTRGRPCKRSLQTSIMSG